MSKNVKAASVSLLLRQMAASGRYKGMLAIQARLIAQGKDDNLENILTPDFRRELETCVVSHLRGERPNNGTKKPWVRSSKESNLILDEVALYSLA